MWGACAIDCQRLGWAAIEYSSLIAWVLAALIIALAGRWSHYEMDMAGVLPARGLKISYSIGCACCIVLMVIAPSLLPEFFPGLVRQVSLRAAGVL